MLLFKMCYPKRFLVQGVGTKMNDLIINWSYKYKPYEWQMEALLKQYGKRFFGLFLDPRMGKTKVVIDEAAIMASQGLLDGLMILCPATVTGEWKKQFRVHGPDNWQLPRKVLSIDGLENMDRFDDAVKKLWSWKWMLVMDESTKIKNFEAKRTKRALRLSSAAYYRRILTGTPITLSALDVYSQFLFLDPSMVFHWEFNRWRKHFCILGGYKGKQVLGHINEDKITRIVDEHGYHNTAEHCLDLPLGVPQKRILELSGKSKKVYAEAKNGFMQGLEGEIITFKTLLVKTAKFEQICAGILYNPDGTVQDLGNEKVDEILNILEEYSGKCIIWYKFEAEKDKIRWALTEKGIEVVVLQGGFTERTQNFVKDQFQTDPNVRVILVQEQINMGIDLSAADLEIFATDQWNPAMRRQAEDRAKAIGKKTSIGYIALVIKGTVDVAKAYRLKQRQDLIDRIMNPNDIKKIIEGDFNLEEWE